MPSRQQLRRYAPCSPCSFIHRGRRGVKKQEEEEGGTRSSLTNSARTDQRRASMCRRASRARRSNAGSTRPCAGSPPCCRCSSSSTKVASFARDSLLLAHVRHVSQGYSQSGRVLCQERLQPVSYAGECKKCVSAIIRRGAS